MNAAMGPRADGLTLSLTLAACAGPPLLYSRWQEEARNGIRVQSLPNPILPPIQSSSHSRHPPTAQRRSVGTQGRRKRRPFGSRSTEHSALSYGCTPLPLTHVLPAPVRCRPTAGGPRRGGDVCLDELFTLHSVGLRIIFLLPSNYGHSKCRPRDWWDLQTDG